MKNNALLWLTFLLFLGSCVANKSLKETSVHVIHDGTYISSNAKKKIVINGNSFLFAEIITEQNPSINDCCDTIIDGEWNYVKGTPFLVVRDLKPAYALEEVSFEVQELVDQNKQDSLFFEIVTPVEDYAKASRNNTALLHYDLGANAVPQTLSVALSNLKFVDGKASVGKPDNSKVLGFSLAISITPAVYLNNVGRTRVYTKNYVPNNKEANVFKILIPGLNLGNFARGGHVDDYIQIKTPDRLLWDGVNYTAQ